MCCLLKAELKQLSFVQNKLLKLTNYHCLATCRSIPELQRMPLVLTLTKTTHVPQFKAAVFSQLFNFPLDFKVPSDTVSTSPFFLCFLLHLSVLLICACLSNQRGTSRYSGPNWWGTWNISIYKWKIAVKQHDFWGVKNSNSLKKKRKEKKRGGAWMYAQV